MRLLFEHRCQIAVPRTRRCGRKRESVIGVASSPGIVSGISRFVAAAVSAITAGPVRRWSSRRTRREPSTVAAVPVNRRTMVRRMNGLPSAAKHRQALECSPRRRGIARRPAQVAGICQERQGRQSQSSNIVNTRPAAGGRWRHRRCVMVLPRDAVTALPTYDEARPYAVKWSLAARRVEPRHGASRRKWAGVQRALPGEPRQSSGEGARRWFRWRPGGRASRVAAETGLPLASREGSGWSKVVRGASGVLTRRRGGGS